MAYYIPIIKKCPKCGFEQAFSRSHTWDAPVSQDGKPYCPKCFDDFIRQHVPQMECTGKRGKVL